MKKNREKFFRKILPIWQGRTKWFLCLLVGCLFYIPLQAQTEAIPRVSLDFEKAPLVKIIESLRMQTHYNFLFNSDELRSFAGISVRLREVTLRQALDSLLIGRKTGLTYTIEKQTVVIRKAGSSVSSHKVSGIVVDDKKRPIPGVTVKLLGTTLGTATDGKGEFSMNLPLAEGTLEFSFVGFKSQQLSFNKTKSQGIQVVLVEDMSNLDEVTVVAYGETTKRNTTGAFSVVKAEDFKGIPSPSIANLLQGRVAGMDVTNISGAPGGGGAQVTIRGYNSLSIESGRRFSNPLWVVDGVPMNSFTSPVTGTNGLADLNPETIESIQVLKDASAASLYGSRAANGVIIVTTKKGKKNQDAQFEVNLSYTHSILPETPIVYGGRGEREFRLNALRNARGAYLDYEGTGIYRYPTSYEDAYRSKKGIYDFFWRTGESGTENGNVYQDSLNPFYNNSSNFFKYYFHAAKTLNANIQTHGGGERMTYSVGLGYYNEDGILKGSGYKRVNLMGNFNMNPTKRVMIDFRTYMAYSDRSRGVRSGGYSSGNEVETIPGDPLELSTLLPSGGEVLKKALEGLQGSEEKNTSYRLRNSFGINIDVIEGLKLSSTLSLDYTQNNRNYFSPSWLSELKESSSVGEIERNVMLLNESLLTYKKDIGMHNLDFMLGFSYQQDQDNYISGSGIGGPSDMVHYVTSGGWSSYIKRENGDIEVLKDYTSNCEEKKMISYFGRLNYNYDEKYMFTFTLRRDGSSVFGRNVRWATFPSVALAWNFGGEKFMEWATPWLNFGKLRMSWGLSGNQFTSAYLAYGILGGGGSYKGEPSMSPNWGNGFYNPNLSWEETEQYDLGVDMNMLNHRLSFTIDYYYRYTDKMLYEISIPGSHSAYNKIWTNAAGISNEGVEFEVKYNLIRNQKIDWMLSFNIAKNWNQFRKSYNHQDLKTSQYNYILGKPLGVISGYKTDGYLQTEEDIVYYYNQSGNKQAIAPPYTQNAFYIPGDNKVVDVNGDMSIDNEDVVYLGSTLPKVYGGIVNELSYKGFDLNILCSYSLGRDMANMARVVSLSTKGTMAPVFEDINNVTFWEKAGDNTDYPRLAQDNYNGNWGRISNRNVEKVNYFKLKTLTLGYSLPKAWMNKTFVKEIRFFFSGENLLTWTNYSGLDPETVDLNTGLDNGKAYPLARKLTLGLTIKL